MAETLLPLSLYHDLCKEIDVLYIRINQLEIERKYYWRMGTDRLKAPMPLDRALKKIYLIDDKLRPLYKIMNEKEIARQNIEKKISEFEGIEYQVAYRRMKGYSLIEIAQDLGYSYDWIRRISSKIGGRTFRKIRRNMK